MNIPKQHLPSLQFKRRAFQVMTGSILFIGICVFLGFNPLLLITDFHHLIALIGEMTPPNFSLIWTKPMILSSIYETLSMSFLGTVLGGSVALLLSFFAAENINRIAWLSKGIKFFFMVERVIPSFIILLCFFIAVGYGPFAGMLSLAVSIFGTFGKLFTESIEQVDPRVIESVKATGANKAQLIRFGILPEAIPSLIRDFFYAFDANTRRAISLGIFGGGGLGFELLKAMGLMEYKSAIALMIIIVVLIFLIEQLSQWLRSLFM